RANRAERDLLAPAVVARGGGARLRPVLPTTPPPGELGSRRIAGAVAHAERGRVEVKRPARRGAAQTLQGDADPRSVGGDGPIGRLRQRRGRLDRERVELAARVAGERRASTERLSEIDADRVQVRRRLERQSGVTTPEVDLAGGI